jgi:hypothetical protein
MTYIIIYTHKSQEWDTQYHDLILQHNDRIPFNHIQHIIQDRKGLYYVTLDQPKTMGAHPRPMIPSWNYMTQNYTILFTNYQQNPALALPTQIAIYLVHPIDTQEPQNPIHTQTKTDEAQYPPQLPQESPHLRPRQRYPQSYPPMHLAMATSMGSGTETHTQPANHLLPLDTISTTDDPGSFPGPTMQDLGDPILWKYPKLDRITMTLETISPPSSKMIQKPENKIYETQPTQFPDDLPVTNINRSE